MESFFSACRVAAFRTSWFVFAGLVPVVFCFIFKDIMLSGLEFHVHVNHFGKTAPDCLPELEALGLEGKESKTYQHGRAKPLWLIGGQSDSPDWRNEVYAKALKIIREDPTLNGYIEHETLDLGAKRRPDEIRFEPQKFDPSIPFPIKKTALSVGRKVADVHVFRDRKRLDELDATLKELGFFRVDTPHSRIWTLLLGVMRHRTHLKKRLETYFQEAGGIKTLQCEIVGRVEAVNGFELAPVTSEIDFTVEGL